ncbi:MAG: ATP-binding protein [Bacteroidota bacterium]
MRRTKLDELISWKNSGSRKPLVIRGARQVGKTWLMKEFGNTQYAQTVYLNFEKNKRLKALFADDFEINRIIVALQAESGLTIHAGNTLLIFDEIQAVPDAISALKYFQEDAPEYHIIAAGSLLGMALHAGISFPVGKVEFMDLYPLTFPEFLNAIGEKALLDMLHSADWTLITVFKTKFIERLRQYYFIGGMPEAVLKFTENQSFKEVRNIQKQILTGYEQDFSKYAPPEIVPRIRMLWNSIPSQLAKENRKFIYGLIKEGSRAREYELALSWLTDCRQVHKVERVSKPALPLKAFEDRSAFKLFLVDVGLLAAMTDLDAATLLEGNAMFSDFKGALTEQYVFQQLNSSSEYVLYYWSAERSSSEVDFIAQYSGLVIPIEVKAEENLQAKSLKVFCDKFNPPVSIRTSMSDFRKQDWLTNLPLYAISELNQTLKGFLLVLLLVLFCLPARAGTSHSDSLQKQFNHLKGADKISMLTSIADKELSGDPAFLKSAIKSILADPSLLKQKGSLDSLYKLVKVLSKY